mgnify:FL=1
MENTRQRKQFHKQAGIWLVALFVVLTAAFMRGKVNVKAAEIKTYIDSEETDEKGYEVGAKVTLSVKVTGVEGKVSYKWYYIDEKGETVDLKSEGDSVSVIKECGSRKYYVDVITDGLSYTDGFYLYATNTLFTEPIGIIYNGTKYASYEDIDEDVKPGDTIKLKADARSEYENANISYQWYEWDENESEYIKISSENGGNKKSISVIKKDKENERYRCVINDGNDKSWQDVDFFGKKEKEEDTLTVKTKINNKFYIAEDDKFFSAEKGAELTFEVDADTTYTDEQGKKNITYEWSGDNIEGEAGNKVTVVKDNSAKEYYSCDVSDGYTSKRYYFYLKKKKTLTVEMKANGEKLWGDYGDEEDQEDKDYDSYNSVEGDITRGKQVTIEAKARTTHIDKDGNKNITYEWEDENGKVIKDETSASYKFMMGKERSLYYCNISDGNYKIRYAIQIYPSSREVITAERRIDGERIGTFGDYYTTEGTSLNLQIINADTTIANEAGEKKITYQWKDKNGQAISNATSSEYKITAGKEDTEYICTLTNQEGDSEDISFYIHIDKKKTLSIIQKINGEKTESYVAEEGTDIILEIEAETTYLDANKKITYQWKDKYGYDIKGQNEKTYKFKKSGISKDDDDEDYGSSDERYRCEISDGNEVIEKSFYLSCPKKEEQPTETRNAKLNIFYNGKKYNQENIDQLNLNIGDTVQLKLAVEKKKANEKITYIWYKYSQDKATEIPGSGNTLTVTKKEQGEEYGCKAIFEDGSSVEREITLSKDKLQVSQKINGNTYNDNEKFKPGDKVTLEVKASTNYVDSDGDKAISYTWKKDNKTVGSSRKITVTKGEDYECYDCTVDDGNEQKECRFNLGTQKDDTLKVKQYINEDNTSTLDNAVYGETYTLQVQAESSYENPDLQYEWEEIDDEGEPVDNIGEESEINIVKGSDQKERYECTVSDGNVSETVSFVLNAETLADINTYVNSVAYRAGDTNWDNQSYYPLAEGQSATLSVKVKTNTGEKAKYSWSRRDRTVSSAFGDNFYIPMDNQTKNTCVIKTSRNTLDTYCCTITVGDITYEKYFFIEKTTLAADGTIEVNDEVVKEISHKYDDDTFVDKGDQVTLKVSAKNAFADKKVTYTWYCGSNIIKGENKENYSFKAEEGGDKEYYCDVSNGTDTVSVYFNIYTYKVSDDTKFSIKQYVNGQEGDSLIEDQIGDTVELKVEAMGDSDEYLEYKWYDSNNLLQDSGNTYILNKKQLNKNQMEIVCVIEGELYDEDDEDFIGVRSCTFNIALKNYTTGAKTFIKTETEEKEENLITVPEGTELTLRVEPSQNEKNLTYTWYNKNAKKQGEGKSLPVTKGSAKDIYYCVVSDGNYTTRYTFTLKKEIICKHENIITDKAVKPTCTKTGLSEGSHCADCDEVIEEQKVLPALGHNWDEGTITKQPSITEEGIREYKCLNAGCQETKTEKIPKLPKPEEPSTEPEKPSTEPTKPSTESEKPSTEPTTKPSTDETKPSKDNKVPATEAPKKNTGTTQKTLKVGTKITDKKSKAVYKVTGKKTVQYVKSTVKNVKTINIPATITANKVKYQVTSIAAKAVKGNKKLTKVVIPASIKNIGTQAFAGCKNLKNITIKTSYLTKKKVGAKAFKGISAKAVIKVPKKQLKAYQKMLISKGVSKKAKIKK